MTRHLVVDDQLLRQTLGHVGDAGVVLDDQLDLLARDRIALLLHVQLRRRLDLPARRGERPGHRQDEADLHRLLRHAPPRSGPAWPPLLPQHSTMFDVAFVFPPL